MSVLKDPAIHVTIEYDQPQEAAEQADSNALEALNEAIDKFMD